MRARNIQSDALLHMLQATYEVVAASYPDVSLSMKMYAQRKAGRRFITSHSRFALASAMRKNEAPEEEADVVGSGKASARIFFADFAKGFDLINHIF